MREIAPQKKAEKRENDGFEGRIKEVLISRNILAKKGWNTSK